MYILLKKLLYDKKTLRKVLAFSNSFGISFLVPSRANLIMENIWLQECSFLLALLVALCRQVSHVRFKLITPAQTSIDRDEGLDLA